MSCLGTLLKENYTQFELYRSTKIQEENQEEKPAEMELETKETGEEAARIEEETEETKNEIEGEEEPKEKSKVGPSSELKQALKELKAKDRIDLSTREDVQLLLDFIECLLIE